MVFRFMGKTHFLGPKPCIYSLLYGRVLILEINTVCTAIILMQVWRFLLNELENISCKGTIWAKIRSFLRGTKGNEEKAMARHSSILAWKIPWTEEPGRLQSTGLLRVGHDWATSLSLSCIGEGNGNPLQCSCLENPRGGEVWWAAVYEVIQSRTLLKWLSSSSSSSIQ